MLNTAVERATCLSDNSRVISSIVSGYEQRKTLTELRPLARSDPFNDFSNSTNYTYVITWPDWLSLTVESLVGLKKLPENWDSYGAATISHESTSNALDLLLLIMSDNSPAPIVTPTNSGTVTLEWHTQGIDMEIEVLGINQYDVIFEDSRKEEPCWDGEIGTDLTRLKRYIALLTSRKHPRDS